MKKPVIQLRKTMPPYDWVSLMDAYRRFVKEQHVVLEIGASNPQLTHDLSWYCEKVIGVELMPDRIPSGFDNVKYIRGDWQYLTDVVERESIDIAVSRHVIEHIPDDLAALNQLYEVLKPGGIALINTPNRKRLTRTIIDSIKGEREFPWWEHVREYTEEDLLRLIDSSKFTKFEIKPLVLGLFGGEVFVYFESVPPRFRKYANLWEVHLFKDHYTPGINK